MRDKEPQNSLKTIRSKFHKTKEYSELFDFIHKCHNHDIFDFILLFASIITEFNLNGNKNQGHGL